MNSSFMTDAVTHRVPPILYHVINGVYVLNEVTSPASGLVAPISLSVQTFNAHT